MAESKPQEEPVMGDMTLNDFKWRLENIGKHANGQNVEILTDEIDEVRVRLYTNNNSYGISARVRSISGLERGYLGCIASSRKPRAGETWTRGSDLADGPFTLETWNKILGDIVAYELVEIHKTVRASIDEDSVEVGPDEDSVEVGSDKDPVEVGPDEDS